MIQESNGLKYEIIDGLAYPISIIKEGRMKGNTTRIINDTVELLFELGKVGIKDHEDYPNAKEWVMGRVLRRLTNELRVQVIKVEEDKYKLNPKLGRIVLSTGNDILQFIKI